MSTQLVSERDALRQAVELAEKKVAHAQSALKHAEVRVAAIEGRIRIQRTKLETLYHRLEKQAARHRHHMEAAHRISVLELQYEQCQLENRAARTRLLETASKRSASARGAVRWPAKVASDTAA